MKIITRILLSALLGLLPSLAAAQTFTLNSTTLSAAATATQGTFVLTSASAASGSSFGAVTAGQFVFVDDEFVQITAVSGTTVTVRRGVPGSRPSAHASGATVWIGAGYAFQRVDPPRGTCTTTAVPSPWINTDNGQVWACATTFWAHPPRDTFAIDVTASTATVGRTHNGRITTLNRAAGIAVTLPAATGSGDTYRFVLGTTVTSNSTTIKVANATDVMTGTCTTLQDGGDTSVSFETASTSDTITWNGSTTGGIKGDYVELIDVASGLWFVRVVQSGTGTEATPFSATV